MAPFQEAPTGLRALAAVALLSLTLAGCGGSSVSEPGIVASQPGQAAAAAEVAGTAPATAAPDEAADAGARVPASAQSGAARTLPAGSAAVGTGGGGKGGGGKGRQDASIPATQGKAAGQGETAVAGRAAGVQSTVRAAPIFGGSRACKPATLSEVVFGNVSTLSGVLGELFAPAVPALNTFMTSQNACGGLNGHKIKILIRDDQGDPSTAISRAQELIQKDRILAFVGNIQVLTIHAMVPTIKAAGIPIIGGDLTSSAWFENPLIFPQAASIQSFAAAYLSAIKNHFKKTVIGNLWCIEVPASCGAVNTALKDMAPKFGIRIAAAPQVSLTQPSFVQECLQMKSAGVEAVVISTDAASAVRFARSCQQVGFFPETLIHQIGIGNEKQFLGNPWLGGTYIPLNTFAHMANRTPAEQYYQASVRKFNPGFVTGGAASTAWTAGALLAAAAANLPAENPSTQDLLDTLYEFRGQDFTRLGGLTATTLTYERGGIPRIPYCHYNAISNAKNTGWASYLSEPICSDLLAPTDPQSTHPRTP